MKIFTFTIADDENLEYAHFMINSLHKFHPDLKVHIVTGDELKKHLDMDHKFFYRATPIIADKYIDDYDLVLKLDADQIVMGNLDYLFNQKYDVGTVLNVNRVDPPRYGTITVSGVAANEYYNCGLVAMKSSEFVRHWLKTCVSKNFDRLQYKEQDLLNLVCHYGQYKVKCFDNYDDQNKYYAWHGLVAKGEGLRMKVVNNEVILPKGEDNYPDKDLKIKLYHFAGGNSDRKYNFRTTFDEKMIQHIEYLIHEKNKKSKKT